MDYLTCGECGDTDDVYRVNECNFCKTCLFWYDVESLENAERMEDCS